VLVRNGLLIPKKTDWRNLGGDVTSGDLDKAKTGIEIVGEVIRLAGDDPSVKAAAGELGKSALTITTAINNALLPLAAVNFAFERARKYFDGRFPEDIARKAESIPSECLVEPKASIAGPALQGLAFAHEEDALRELFLELIAGAMDSRRAASVHPAFAEILRQLEAEEAQLLEGVLHSGAHAIANVTRKMKKGAGRQTLRRHVLELLNERDEPAYVANLPAMVDNWSRLGLVEVAYDSTLSDQSRYDFLDRRPEIKAYPPEAGNSEYRLEWHKGILTVTEFGKQFATAIGVVK
jgi:hypothetical protein